MLDAIWDGLGFWRMAPENTTMDWFPRNFCTICLGGNVKRNAGTVNNRRWHKQFWMPEQTPLHAHPQSKFVGTHKTRPKLFRNNTSEHGKHPMAFQMDKKWQMFLIPAHPFFFLVWLWGIGWHQQETTKQFLFNLRNVSGLSLKTQSTWNKPNFSTRMKHSNRSYPPCARPIHQNHQTQQWSDNTVASRRRNTWASLLRAKSIWNFLWGGKNTSSFSSVWQMNWITPTRHHKNGCVGKREPVAPQQCSARSSTRHQLLVFGTWNQQMGNGEHCCGCCGSPSFQRNNGNGSKTTTVTETMDSFDKITNEYKIAIKTKWIKSKQ